jgi:ABC-type nickel/cobalt efflux system permease component RcnA
VTRARAHRIGWLALLVAAWAALAAAPHARAHPMGNFSVSRYAAIRAEGGELILEYRVDQAEIPTVQEMAQLDADRSGDVSSAEHDAYLARAVAELTAGQSLAVDGRPLALEVSRSALEIRPGSAELPTLWIAIDYRAALPGGAAQYRIEYRDANYPGRTGWREVVAAADGSWSVIDASVPASDRSRGLTQYPEDPALAPPQVSEAALTLRRTGAPGDAPVSPATAVPGAPAEPAAPDDHSARPHDAFADLIAARDLSLRIVLFSIAAAFLLGGFHALSPGHGKTVVAGYLVGSRGTFRHALLLGAVVTITHTAGVFALGFVALAASEYVLPEQLYPWLGTASGLLIVAIGAWQFSQRWSLAHGGPAHGHDHDHHDHDHGHDHGDGHHHHRDHGHDHGHGHHHGPGGHSHAMPEKLSARSLIALGVSGGIVPCPSALVVLLSAVTLHRIGLGLVLIVAFSAGLAAVLTAIGMLVLYARRALDRMEWGGAGVLRQLPLVSSLLITALGAVLAVQSASAAQLPAVGLGWLAQAQPIFTPEIALASVLGLGFALGLQHALDADHIAAVCAIVSENRSVLRSSLIGAFWGLGHTASLFLVGLVVIGLRLTIPEPLALGLEFCVAIMLVALGVNALRKSLRIEVHRHAHAHAGAAHAHDGDAPHVHASEHAHLHVHVIGRGHHELPLLRQARRPLLIGMVHGLAGSAALMLLVLSTISSPWIGLAYVAIFGIGSIGGMGLMSSVIGLPFAFTAIRFERVHRGFAVAAGLFSLGFGLYLGYEIGFVEGLFR